MNFRDVELLSAYLDGRLSPPDKARLEARLASDETLKLTLADLRETRRVLRQLPQRRAPRNFRLTPKMVGVRAPEPRAYPAFRFATALAAFLFLAAVALNALTPFAASRLAAPAAAPAYGMGGGGGGYGGGGSGGGSGGDGSPAPEAPAAPAATEAPLLAPFAAALPTGTAEGTSTAELATPTAAQAQDTARASGLAATPEANKAAPVQPPIHSEPEQPQPVPYGWVVALGVLMLILGLTAWALRALNERRIRNQWNQK